MAQYVPPSSIIFTMTPSLKITKITKAHAIKKDNFSWDEISFIFFLLFFSSLFYFYLSQCLRALSDLNFEFAENVVLTKAGSDIDFEFADLNLHQISIEISIRFLSACLF